MRRIFLQKLQENLISQLSIAFISIFYAGTNSSTQEGIQSTRGVLYLTISEVIFMVTYSVVYELPGELVLYMRENTVYAPGPYYLATVLALVITCTLEKRVYLRHYYGFSWGFLRYPRRHSRRSYSRSPCIWRCIPNSRCSASAPIVSARRRRRSAVPRTA